MGVASRIGATLRLSRARVRRAITVLVVLAVAAATGVMYLEASGIPLKPTRNDAIALRDLLRDPTCTTLRIATLLRTWPTTT